MTIFCFIIEIKFHQSKHSLWYPHLICYVIRVKVQGKKVVSFLHCFDFWCKEMWSFTKANIPCGTSRNLSLLTKVKVKWLFLWFFVRINFILFPCTKILTVLDGCYCSHLNWWTTIYQFRQACALKQPSVQSLTNLVYINSQTSLQLVLPGNGLYSRWNVVWCRTPLQDNGVLM